MCIPQLLLSLYDRLHESNWLVASPCGGQDLQMQCSCLRQILSADYAKYAKIPKEGSTALSQNRTS